MLRNSKNSHMYGDIFFPLGITTHIMLDRKTTNDAHILQPAKVLIRMWLPAPIFAAEFLTKAYTAAISKIVANGNEKRKSITPAHANSNPARSPAKQNAPRVLIINKIQFISSRNSTRDGLIIFWLTIAVSELILSCIFVPV